MKKKSKIFKNYKKEAKQQRKTCDELKKLIKNFSWYQWLYFIAQMDRRGLESGFTVFKPEFYSLVIDLALRLAPKEEKLPSSKLTDDHYKRIIHLFLGCDDTPRKLLKELSLVALPLAYAWQNKFSYPPTNILGRMHLLYKEHKKDIMDATGLTVLEIHTILLLIYHQLEIKKAHLILPSAFIGSEIKILNEKNIYNFFDFFSINTEGYRLMAKKHKVYDNTFGRFNLLNRYPIINLEDGSYIVPIKDQLIDSVAANLYFHILEHKSQKDLKESRRYLDRFGYSLENYVLELSRFAFGEKNVVPADEIVKSDNRCEAIAFGDNNALAIEVKKLNFKRDTLSEADMKDIDKKLVGHVGKAIDQLKNTLDHIDVEYKYGLIVIPDIAISPYMLVEYFNLDKASKTFFLPNNILICTLSTYEALTAQSTEIIFEVLKIVVNQEIKDGKDIESVLRGMVKTDKKISFIHPLCREVFEKELAQVDDAELKKLIAARKNH